MAVWDRLHFVEVLPLPLGFVRDEGRIWEAEPHALCRIGWYVQSHRRQKGVVFLRSTAVLGQQYPGQKGGMYEPEELP